MFATMATSRRAVLTGASGGCDYNGISPRAAHAIGMSRNREAFWHVVHAFPSAPA